MKSSAKLHATVIYYLGEQERDARQITGPAGGQDIGKTGPGGEEEDEEEPPSAFATADSSSAQQSLWGGFVTAGS